MTLTDSIDSCEQDYACFVPYRNRPDLLEQVCRAFWNASAPLTVVDNSAQGLIADSGGRWRGATVARALVPLSFTQSMNYEMEETLRQGKRFCVHAHSDAVIPPEAIHRLLEFARAADAEDSRWSVIFTHYDVLAVYNPRCYEEIGGYDTTFSAYFSDNDWYRRAELAGWRRINSGISVGHVGSQTINSDSWLQFHNGVTFDWYRQYYKLKWGGGPGEELFTTPFASLLQPQGEK